MTDWVKGEIKKIQLWTNTLFSITVNAPIAPFSAGQFTKIGLMIDDQRICRPYSYVNAPDDLNLEFYLVSIPKGILSPHLALLKPGDEVQIAKKASGFFTIDGIPDCETLWMLSTGTAIGPYLSILSYGKDIERFQNIVLVHATRYSSDLSYLPKMLALKKHYKGKLHLLTIVSREKVSGSLQGRIPLLIENGKLEKAVDLPINVKTSHVMLCGNPKMVQHTQQLLKHTRSMKKHLRRNPGHITVECYW